MSSKFHRKSSSKRSTATENREQTGQKCTIAFQKKRISFLNILHLFLWVLLILRQITQFWKINVENKIINHVSNFIISIK